MFSEGDIETITAAVGELEDIPETGRITDSLIEIRNKMQKLNQFHMEQKALIRQIEICENSIRHNMLKVLSDEF